MGEARLPVGCCCYANKQRSKVPEPSMICVFIADGWLCLYRTVHDIGLWRGRFASEIWTVRDIESQRGRFNPWIPNHPWFGPKVWKVRSWRMEPTAKWSISVEGSTPGSRTIRDMCLYRGRLALFISNCPRYRPLAWKVRAWMLNHPWYEALMWKVRSWRMEPSVICVFIVEGWLCLHRTVRDEGPKCGGFAPGCLTIHDMGH